MNLKRRWPLVMQMPTRAGFDSILSRDFTFIGDGRLLNREDYINDRTAASEWKITQVKYSNLMLQFFADQAILTYKNEVKNENIRTQETELEFISWADVYVIENGKWKIRSAHTIDLRIEKE